MLFSIIGESFLSFFLQLGIKRFIKKSQGTALGSLIQVLHSHGSCKKFYLIIMWALLFEYSSNGVSSKVQEPEQVPS